jgi:hypothetical protein
LLSHHGGGLIRPVWEGISTDSLKFHPVPPSPTLIRPVGRPLPKRPYSHLGVARPQGGQPAAVFFLLGYPIPYGPVGLGEAIKTLPKFDLRFDPF